uniref:Uncharacterized protein n=1 Tax=Leersia perrieri TaxID=77586 RepID=A0A0D9W453_9ORYZ
MGNRTRHKNLSTTHAAETPRDQSGDDDHITDIAGELCYAHKNEHTWDKKTYDVWVAAVDDDDPVAAPEWSLRWRVDLDLCGLATGKQRWFHNLVPTADGEDVAMFMAMLCNDKRRYVWTWSKPMVKIANHVQGSRYNCEPTPTIHHVIRYVESLVSIRSYGQD